MNMVINSSLSDKCGSIFFIATIALSVDQNTSIAYSSDGNLYAVTSADDSGSGFSIYTIDPNTGVFEAIDSEESDIEDPLSDISRGPLM